jgi:chaperonin GroES
MLQPIRDFVLVSVHKEPETTAGGLIIRPSTVDEKIVSGTILAIGSGHLTTSSIVVPLEVGAGDKVLFNKTMSVEVKHNGETYHLLREEHVLAVVR